MPETPNNGAGGDGGAPPAPSAGAKGATPPSDQGSDENPRRASARSLIARYGAERAVMRLEKENFRLRETRREVPQGAVVLTGDDATAYQAFKALNLTPAQVTSALKEREELKTWKGTRERQDQIGEMAGKVGYKPSVLTTLLAPKLAEGAKLEYRDVEVERNGKKETASVPHLVTGSGEHAKAERLTAVVERDFADFLPSLKAEGAARGSTSASNGDPPPPVRYPSQRKEPSDGKTASDPLERLSATRATPSRMREQREKRLGLAS